MTIPSKNSSLGSHIRHWWICKVCIDLWSEGSRVGAQKWQFLWAVQFLRRWGRRERSNSLSYRIGHRYPELRTLIELTHMFEIEKLVGNTIGEMKKWLCRCRAATYSGNFSELRRVSLRLSQMAAASLADTASYTRRALDRLPNCYRVTIYQRHYGGEKMPTYFPIRVIFK